VLDTKTVNRVVLDLPDPAATGADCVRYDQQLNRLRGRTAAALAFGEPNPDLLPDPIGSPGTAAWMALRKHAIALHPLYCAPELDTLGAGLAIEDLDEPLADGLSPFDLLAHFVGHEKAARVRRRV
jgi:hypothetical protein